MKSKLGKKLHISILACLGIAVGLLLLSSSRVNAADCKAMVPRIGCVNDYDFSCRFNNKNFCCKNDNGQGNAECQALKGQPPAGGGATPTSPGPVTRGSFNVGINNPNFTQPNLCGSGSIDTALGCIPYEFEPFTTAALNWLVGIAGALSMSIMIYAAILRAFAGDNQELLKKANEQFTAGAVGLLFIIFSVTILSIIAGRLLFIPGF